MKETSVLIVDDDTRLLDAFKSSLKLEGLREEVSVSSLLEEVIQDLPK